MIIRSAGITVPGKIRGENQDNFYINGTFKSDTGQKIFAVVDSRELEINLFAVCDGMGGYSHGELASLKALEVLKTFEKKDIFKDPETYVSRANEAICNEISTDGKEPVGATLALMCAHDRSAVFCNIGDSRIYMIRGRKMDQISHDHTRAQSMVDAGIIDREKARSMKEAHILSQHLGISEDEFVICPETVRDHEIKKGDIYLICSDGLTSMLSDEQIFDIVRENRDKELKVIATLLTDAACEAGGEDNITVIIARADRR